MKTINELELEFCLACIKQQDNPLVRKLAEIEFRIYCEYSDKLDFYNECELSNGVCKLNMENKYLTKSIPICYIFYRNKNDHLRDHFMDFEISITEYVIYYYENLTLDIFEKLAEEYAYDFQDENLGLNLYILHNVALQNPNLPAETKLWLEMQ